MEAELVENETRVTICSDADIVIARQNGRAIALELGFSQMDATLIATAISELARNIICYAKDGEMILQPLWQDQMYGIAIIARDRGPGIADVSMALQVGYSTSGSLGLGLPGVRRLMDEFTIQSSSDTGTTVTLKKWKR